MIGDIPASDRTELEVSETGWSFVLFVGLVVETRSAVVVLSLGVVVVEVGLEVAVRDEVNNK